MKKNIAIGILVFLGLYLIFSFHPPQRIEGMNFSKLAELPLLQNGRIKPLDTVARTALTSLTGKQTLNDGIRKMTALQWFLETVTKPNLADEFRLFPIKNPDVKNFLGFLDEPQSMFSFKALLPHLKQIWEQGDEASKLDSAEMSAFQKEILLLKNRLWMYFQIKNTFKSEDITSLTDELGAYQTVLTVMTATIKHGNSTDALSQDSIDKLAPYITRFRFMDQTAFAFAIPPISATHAIDNWSTVGKSLLDGLRQKELNPAIRHWASILESYKNSDSLTFNSSVFQYITYLKTLHHIPFKMVKLELFFNYSQPLYKSIVLYVAVFLMAISSWIVLKPELKLASYYGLLLAFGVHTIGLFLRIIIQGRPPVTNLYSSAVFVGWGSILLGILLEKLFKNGLGILVSGLIGFVTLIIAHNLSLQGDTMEMMQAVLDSNFWLSTHVITICIGYSATFLAGFLAIVYILKGLFTTSLDPEQERSIGKMVYGVICFGLLFSFIGTILGGIWADQSWGRFWGWDPKENGALMIVLWNAVILHARLGKMIKTRGLMLMAVFGNIVTSFSWFGVNMLGIGLHSYGFMGQAFIWLSLFIVSQLIIIVIGSLPFTYWKSFRKSDTASIEDPK